VYFRQSIKEDIHEIFLIICTYIRPPLLSYCNLFGSNFISDEILIIDGTSEEAGTVLNKIDLNI
jgi:hypothetical protein